MLAQVHSAATRAEQWQLLQYCQTISHSTRTPDHLQFCGVNTKEYQPNMTTLFCPNSAWCPAPETAFHSIRYRNTATSCAVAQPYCHTHSCNMGEIVGTGICNWFLGLSIYSCFFQTTELLSRTRITSKCLIKFNLEGMHQEYIPQHITTDTRPSVQHIKNHVLQQSREASRRGQQQSKEGNYT